MKLEDFLVMIGLTFTKLVMRYHESTSPYTTPFKNSEKNSVKTQALIYSRVEDIKAGQVNADSSVLL